MTAISAVCRRLAAAILAAMMLAGTFSAPVMAAENKDTKITSDTGIELRNAILPAGTLAEGSAFTVGGEIVADKSLLAVQIVVTDSKDREQFKCGVKPDGKTCCLQEMDSQMTFSKLKAGDYTVTVNAVTAFGWDSFERNFKVRKSSIRSDGNCTAPDKKLKKGSTFSCKGTVRCDKKIAKVVMSVRTTAGVEMFSASAAPGSKTYDLHKLDGKMTFRKLPAGR